VFGRDKICWGGGSEVRSRTATPAATIAAAARGEAAPTPFAAVSLMEVAYDAARENEPDDPDAGESRQGKRCDDSRDPVRAPVARGIRIRNEHGHWCNPDAGGKEKLEVSER
jgi:hypothetical protein